MTPSRRRPYGPEAWLIEDMADPAGWAAALAARRIDGVVDIVPGARTVLVRCRRGRTAAIGDLLDGVVAEPVPARARDDVVIDVVIDVVYDGDDLDDLAERTGLSVDQVVAAHRDATYTVAFCGFSPGFGYLTGLDDRLHVPRRATPRRSVPAGSVGIAAGYSCVYPTSSPGGWHLIGRTEQALWELDRTPPALLRPGLTVRFREVGP